MVDDLNRIAEFLALRNFLLGERVDCVVLLGSAMLDTAHVAVRALREGGGGFVLISGGDGHSTHELREQIAAHPRFHDIEVEGRPEARILCDLLTGHFGVDPGLIVVEDRSMNCGSNAVESKVVLDAVGGVGSLLLIQDPTMQRRSQACFERSFGASTRVFSYAPFAPHVVRVGDEWIVSGAREPVWQFERFVALLLGEIDRLRDDEHGYGPRGRNYIDHVDVPSDVLQAWSKVRSRLPHFTRAIA